QRLHGRGCEHFQTTAESHRGGRCSPGCERLMRDVPDPTDTGGGGRELTTSVPSPSPVRPKHPTPDSRAGALDSSASRPGRPVSASPILEFERVSKFYGPVIGINQVTLELRPGITGLVGANGAGKSTLMRLAAGQTRPGLGRVLGCGYDARSAEARLPVGYRPAA